MDKVTLDQAADAVTVLLLQRLEAHELVDEVLYDEESRRAVRAAEARDTVRRMGEQVLDGRC